MNRRELLAGAALGPLVGCASRRPEAVRAENDKPGTRDWLLTKTAVDPKTRYRCPTIEGYCSHTSIRAGEELRLMVSTNPPAPFTIDLYRLGYYGGTGGRRVATLGPLKGTVQPDPPVGPQRLRQCAWEPSSKVVIPADWPSGVYLGKLTERTAGFQSYLIFIVRDDRPCDFLFQCSDTTWSAYNRWPNQWSLYDDGNKEWYWGPDVAVSWDRPYGKYCQIADWPLSQGSGEFLLWEFPLAYWMEQQGYDVSYISNTDTHADAAGLLRAKGWLSVGHDEYWSQPMYDNVKGAVAKGLNAAFFSGNSVCGLIGMEGPRAFARTGTFGGFGHTEEAHRAAVKAFPELARFKDSGPNEALLMGASSTTYPFNGTADWACVHEKHWLFEGTGMKNGDAIRGLVGWEHHGQPAEIPGLEVVARGPVSAGGKPRGVDFTATVYPGPAGNWVFNAATIWWSDGLSEPPGYKRPSAHGGTPPGPDPRVQQITRNLFRRFTEA